MPETSTNDSLKLANVQIDDLLTMGTDAPVDLDEHGGAPAAPSSGKVRLYAKADSRLYLKDDAGTEVALDPTTGGAVLKTLFEANSILAADSDDTPAALAVAEQRLVGRISGGNIDDLTVVQVLALLAPTLGRRAISGRFYRGGPFGSGRRGTGAFSLAADCLYGQRLYSWGETWNSIGIEVGTADAGKGVTLGIYDAGADGLPNNLVWSGSALDISSTGFKQNTSIAQTLPVGWQWLAMLSDSSSGELYAEAALGGMQPLGRAAVTDDYASMYIYKTGQAYTSGLPDPFPSSPAFAASDAVGPFIVLEAS